jgi:hypothetical protein
VLRRFAGSVDAAMIDRIAQAMVDSMVTAVAELESAPDFRAEVFDASRETASGFLASVDRGVYVTPEIPPALADLALTLARRGLDATVLMKLARHGQAVYWPALMEFAEREIEEPSARMRVLTTIYERFSRYMEDSLDRAIAVYQGVTGGSAAPKPGGTRRSRRSSPARNSRSRRRAGGSDTISAVTTPRSRSGMPGP